MGLGSRITHFFRNLIVKADTQLTFLPPWVRSTFFAPVFRSLAAEGFKKNSAVFAAGQKLAKSFQEPPLMAWKLNDTGDLVRDLDSPFRQLITNPNPDQGEAEFIEACILFMAISGNVYIWKQRSTNGNVVGLYPFSDALIQPIPSTNTVDGIVSHFEMAMAGTAETVSIDKRDIIHIKWLVDPVQPWLGMGAIAAAAGQVSTDSEISSYLFSLLKNDATPSVVINVPEGVEFSDEKARRLKAQWFSNYGGRQRGRPAILESGFEVTQLSYNLQSLAYDALHRIPESRIAASFDVPPILIGLLVGLEFGTYSNYEQARLAFSQDSLKPRWRAFASEFQASMRNEIGMDGITIQFDLSVVSSLQANQNELRTQALAGWTSGVLTRAEARQVFKVPQRAGDDIYMSNLTTIFDPAGTIETPKALQAGERKAPGFSRNVRGGDIRRATRREVERWKGFADAQRNIRANTIDSMIDSLDVFFADLGQKIAQQLSVNQVAGVVNGNGAGLQFKQPLTPQDLRRLEGRIFDQIDTLQPDLTRIVKQSYLTVIAGTWELVNQAMEEQIDLDTTDPFLVPILERAEIQSKIMTESTKERVKGILARGAERGWSIEQLVMGDDGLEGLNSVIVNGGYKNRARTIARTELGNAQNRSSVARYDAGGAVAVQVYDNGLKDDDTRCRDVNGAIKSFAWARNNVLEHPNCTRTFTPIFEDELD